jgi:hypothetical protein
MSKQLGNLQRLHQKLEAALGTEHPHVRQLQAEIESHAQNVKPPARCAVVQRQRELSRTFNHRWHSIHQLFP